MSLPKYSVLIDSGVDWLGTVPKHWRMKRLRFVARLNPSKSELSGLSRETLVSFLPMNAVGDDGTLNLEQDRPLEAVEQGYTYFKDGDVTIAKITPCFENGKGAVMAGLTNGVGFGTTELIVARPCPGEVASKYLHYLFVSAPFRRLGEASMYGAGGQKRVPDDFVRDFSIIFPPEPEQEIIVNFLDQETSKIDALITEQQRLIELLKEKRQAVISHAVTKGLNPDVRMKPSGVEWLGEVPEHWEVMPIKIGFSVVLGKMLQPKQGRETDAECSYLRAANIGWHGAEISDVKTMWFSPYEMDKLRLRKGDLLVSEGGDVGRSCIWLDEIQECYFQNSINRIRPKGTHLSKFLYYCLYAIKASGFIDILCNKSTIAHFTAEKVANLLVAFPSSDEQLSICHFLDQETSQIDILTDRVESAIDLLTERRTALISAAVTGKIDVRNYASTQKDAA